MKKWWLVLVAMTVLAASCGAKNKVEGAEGDDESPGGDSSSETVATDGDVFGDMESPCGDGDYTVEPAESGGSTDAIRIGVPNDRSSQIRPGLNKELWDASTAFVAWCNAQGGIGGLPIELVDLDGKLLEVEPAMAEACSGVFMMAGGGQVQDNLQFSERPGSDFHLCKLAEIPGFTVSPEKSESNGQIQPIPHPSASAPGLWARQFAELYPDEAESMVTVWGDLPSMETIRNQSLAVMENEGIDDAGVFDYPVTGLPDWTPLAQQIIATDAQSLTWVGEPTNFGSLVKSLREQGWDGYPVVETNIYDQVFIDTAGAGNAEGTIIRTIFHPFEEAGEWPAVQQYMDIVNENVEDPKIALLGMQSFSSWLLLATAANDCAESNDGVLSRACVLEAAADVDGWTAGGLHAPTDPGPQGGPSPSCGMLITVNGDGEFERLYPEIGGDADAGDGFECAEDSVTEVPENEGLGTVSPDQPI